MESDSVPVIDISAFLPANSGGPSDVEKVETALKIRDACERAGFFYVRNHGIPRATTARVLHRAKQLFEDVPFEERRKLSVTTNRWFRGYIGEAEPLDTCGDGEDAAEGVDAGVAGGKRRAKETKQSFTIGAEPGRNADGALVDSPMHGPNMWPLATMAVLDDAPDDDVVPENDRSSAPQNSILDEPAWAAWRADVVSYWDACLELSRAISRGLALSLDLEEGFFEGALTHPCAQMVLLRYANPVRAKGVLRDASAETDSTTSATDGPPADDEGVGCGAHTDCGFLTILAQDAVGGLEVKHADGRWIDAPPLENCFVVNLGDMAERWSNDRYKSTRHRVTYKKVMDVRYSVPFFCNCNFDTKVESVGAPASRAGAAAAGVRKYETTTAGAYIMEKLGLMRV